jgi:hypothetical protein
MRYARHQRLTLAAAGFVAGLLLSGAAFAQQIPPLAEVPAAIAKAHPELVSRRAALAKERDALHAQFDQHNRDCRSVEEGSPQDMTCITSQKRLSAALDRHIAASQAFDGSFGSDIVEPGDVLKDAPKGNQSPSPPKGKQPKPKPNPPPNSKPPNTPQVFNTESACQAEFERRDRPCTHSDYTDAKCDNGALAWKAACEALLPADGWGR